MVILLSSKISARDVDPSLINDLGGATKSYVDQQVINISQTGIPKLMVYPFSIVAETEGQTVFEIPLDTFDANTDTVFVQSGRTMISPNEDFSVVDNSVVLTEGVPVERVITIYVFKNVPIGEDGSVSGSVIMPGSLTLDRLSALPTAEQVGAVPSAMIEGGLHRSFPSGTNTASTMAEIYDACVNGITLLPPSWGCASYSPSGANETCEVIIFKSNHGESYQDYINALGINKGQLSVYNRKTDAWVGFLPLTGGTLSGHLQATTAVGFSLGELADYGMGELQIRIKDRTNNANIRYISLDDMTLMSKMSDALKLVDFKDGYYTSHKIFGAHNKPYGSYTGNGSTAERIINTNGIGRGILVFSEKGTAWVSNKGAVKQLSNGTISGLSYNKVIAWDGTMKLYTNDEVLNASGINYDYQVL